LKKRILGLDIGEKRIGVAISDASQTIARELEIIQVANQKQALQEIAKICSENNIEKIIVGLPLNSDGEDTEQTKRVRNFVEKIKNYEIEFIDERFTSQQALKIQQKVGMKAKKSKKNLDSLAAVIILQTYLDSL